MHAAQGEVGKAPSVTCGMDRTVADGSISFHEAKDCYSPSLVASTVAPSSQPKAQYSSHGLLLAAVSGVNGRPNSVCKVQQTKLAAQAERRADQRNGSHGQCFATCCSWAMLKQRSQEGAQVRRDGPHDDEDKARPLASSSYGPNT